ncbi:MAG: amino acid permease, partial [Planctomycetota bacterium]|nr:amino acid permease [Planctomycetota bacterium]
VAFAVRGTERAAPLAIVARGFETPGAAAIVSIGAITAMLGVLLNLILGLSRVALAMGRRGDLPRVFGRLDRSGRTPIAAVIGVGVVIVGLACIGSVSLAWSFSAFTVLIYYALTNLAAIRLAREARLYPVWIAWAGLIGCLSLSVWIEPRVAAAGAATLAVGLALRWVIRRATLSAS